MPSYYTQKGDYIKNLTAYAKTGAPMYTSKYDRSHNINKPHDIYKVECSDGKKYIGKYLTIRYQEVQDDIPRFGIGIGIRDYE